MKKRICLLLTLVLSLFIFSGRVEAEVLKCLYESKYMLIQEETAADVKWRFYSCNDTDFWGNGKCDFNSPSDSWELSSSDVNFDDTSVYDGKKLLECPPYYSPSGVSAYEKFYDEKSVSRVDYGLPESFVSEEETDTSNKIGIFYSSEEYEDEINNGEWLGTCSYGIDNDNKFTMYFNENDFILSRKDRGEITYNYENSVEFSLSDLIFLIENNYYNDVYNCPNEIYVKMTDCLGNVSVMSSNGYKYYLSNPNFSDSDMYGCTITTKEYPLYDGSVDFGWTPKIEPVDPTIDDCQDLFGDELVEQINKVMDIVKIAVPILLIAFGIIDFTKAVFAGSEDNMKKAQKTFFTRILAAILVFIVPIFINLILSLANEVWGYISPETCIGQSK